MIKPWPIVSLLFQNVFFQCGDYYYNLESFASSSSYREGFICSSLWVGCPQTYILGPASRSLSIYLSGLVTLLHGPLKQIIKITLVPMYLLLRPYNQQNIIIIVTQEHLKYELMISMSIIIEAHLFLLFPGYYDGTTY